MSIEYKPETVRCEAWNWLEAAITYVEEPEYDEGFKFMRLVLGFDYSERFGHLVAEDVNVLWQEIKNALKPKGC